MRQECEAHPTSVACRLNGCGHSSSTMLMLGLGVGTLAWWVPHTPSFSSLSVVELCYFHSFDKGSHVFPLLLGANVKAETIRMEAEDMASSVV